MLPERFWAKVDKSGPPPAHQPELGGCWLWTAAIYPFGYGAFNLNGVQRAHRLAYLDAGGQLANGECVLHRCDVPACVRPEHLFAGTRTENMADKLAKGRAVRPYNQARGERTGGSKLTENDVREIRRRYGYRGHGGEPQWLLAEQYGVTQVLVGKIVRREIWAHVY